MRHQASSSVQVLPVQLTMDTLDISFGEDFSRGFLLDQYSLPNLDSVELDFLEMDPPPAEESRSTSSATVLDSQDSLVGVVAAGIAHTPFVDESGSELAGYIPMPHIEQPLPPSRHKKTTDASSSSSPGNLPKIVVHNQLVKRPFGPPGLNLSGMGSLLEAGTDRDTRGFSPVLTSSELKEVEGEKEKEKEKEKVPEVPIERNHIASTSVTPKVLLERLELSMVQNFEQRQRQRLKEQCKQLEEDLALSDSSSDEDEQMEDVLLVEQSRLEETPQKAVKTVSDSSVTSPGLSVASSSSVWKSPRNAEKGLSDDEELEGDGEESLDEVDGMKCGFCPQRFTVKWNKTRHEKLHQQTGRKFQCSYCNLSCHTAWVVTKHEKLHTEAGDKPSLKKPSSVSRNNIPIIHSEEDSETEEEKDDQQEEEEDVPSGKVKCSHCPQLCHRRNIKGHEEMHSRDKGKYQCEHCSYASNNMAPLIAHQKFHETVRVKTAAPNGRKSTPKNPSGKKRSSKAQEEAVKALKDKWKSALRVRLGHMVMNEAAVDRTQSVERGTKRPLHNDDKPSSATKNRKKSTAERLDDALSLFLPRSRQPTSSTEPSKPFIPLIIISSDEEGCD